MTEAVEVRGAGRDPADLRDRLTAWFAARLPEADPLVFQRKRALIEP